MTATGPTSAAIRPQSRPEASRDFVAGLCGAAGLDPEREVIVVGRRGYYLRTMGDPARNDRNVYDDAVFVIGPSHYSAWNANTDPSRGAPNRATLVCGTWRLRRGMHPLWRPQAEQYPAWRQDGDFVVEREGTASVAAGVRDNRGLSLGGGRWRGQFGINLHRGGYGTTSSEGCQTIPPEQWPDFDRTLHALVGDQPFPYLLTEHTGS